MARFGRLAWISAALLPLGFPTTSRAQSGNDEAGEICLSIGSPWVGTADDIARIHETPVPQSFRAALEAGGCRTFQLIKTGLIDWHLAFGDEATAGAALAYLERQMLRNAPARLNLVSEVEAVARGSEKRSRWEVRDVVESYRFVSSEYLRAADFYTSPALLARSRRYADAVVAVARVLRPKQASERICPPTDDPCAERWVELRDNYSDWRAFDLEMRLAVVSARLGGTEADFAIARETFARNDDPNYSIAASVAYEHGDSFCDIGDRSDLTAWHEACEEGNFDRQALSYWHSRALFEQAAGAVGFPGLGGQWDTETALRLRHADIADHSSDGLPERRFGEMSQQITELRFGQAEALFGKARREGQEGSRQSRGQAKEDYYYALTQLWASAYLVQGSDHPGWLMRIGTRYLEGEAALRELELASDGVRPLSPDIQRRSAWFRAILPQLDTIARGDGVN